MSSEIKSEVVPLMRRSPEGMVLDTGRMVTKLSLEDDPAVGPVHVRENAGPLLMKTGELRLHGKAVLVHAWEHIRERRAQ